MSFPILRVFIENPELRSLYKTSVAKHNQQVQQDPFPNSGFDLFVPTDYSVPSGYESVKVNLEVKCCMEEDRRCIGFYTYLRSSVSNTPLSLANHVGIIDSGYRGNLISAVRNLANQSTEPYIIKQHTRIIQICHPCLKPFLVEIVDSIEALGTMTSRGEGGFGSTGV
jgi:dUTP pyrophosphatase